MKHVVFVFGSILLLAASAGAQADSGSPLQATTPAPESTFTAPATAVTYAFVPATASPFGGAFSASAAPAASSAASSDSAAQGPVVQSVFQTYNWQAYFGYTFFHFNIVPKFTDNMNGLNLGIVFYPGGRWYAADGEFVGTFGSAGGDTTKFVMGMGGGRSTCWSWGRGWWRLRRFYPRRGGLPVDAFLGWTSLKR